MFFGCLDLLRTSHNRCHIKSQDRNMPVPEEGAADCKGAMRGINVPVVVDAFQSILNFASMMIT